MSVKMICDNCGAEVEVSPCPPESVERWHRLDGGGATQPAYLCSWQCVRDYAAAIIADGEGGQSGKQDTGGGLGVAQVKQSERDTLEINRLERERDRARARARAWKVKAKHLRRVALERAALLVRTSARCDHQADLEAILGCTWKDLRGRRQSIYDEAEVDVRAALNETGQAEPTRSMLLETEHEAAKAVIASIDQFDEWIERTDTSDVGWSRDEHRRRYTAWRKAVEAVDGGGTR